MGETKVIYLKGGQGVFGLDSDMIFRIPALLIALTVHEYAHARIAVAYGDNTPRYMGRLTLNPIPHLDPIGLIMLFFFKFGWAKPVSVNPNNFTNWKAGTIMVSLAGAGANILVALIAAFLFALCTKLDVLSIEVAKILSMTYSYNLIFAIFNILPIPPLDGSKVLGALLPSAQSQWLERMEPYGPFLLLGLVYIGVIGVITWPIELLLSHLISGIVALFL